MGSRLSERPRSAAGTHDLVAAAFDLILESVGGDSLRDAVRLISSNGTIVSFGNSSRRSTVLPTSDLYAKQAIYSAATTCLPTSSTTHLRMILNIWLPSWLKASS